MTPDEERWAEALAVNRQHGDDVEEVIAERITIPAPTGILSALHAGGK